MTETAQEADMERLFEMVIITELFHDSLMNSVKKKKEPITVTVKNYRGPS